MTQKTGIDEASLKATSGRRWAGVLIGLLGGILLLAGYFVAAGRHGGRSSSPAGWRDETRGESAPPPGQTDPDNALGEIGPTEAPSRRHLWPHKEVVIGPPAGAPGAAKKGGPKEKTATTDDGARRPHAPLNARSAMKLATSPKPSQRGSRAASNKVGKRPPPPSAQKVQQVAGWKVGEEGTLEKARALLLDADQSSTLKLLAIEKVRKFPADRAVPILLEFLESSRPPDDAYTAPTAVRALVDLRHPLGDEALAKLAKSPRDERVRLAIASLWGEGRGK